MFQLTEGVVPGRDDEHDAEGLRRDPRRRWERHERSRDLNERNVAKQLGSGADN